MINSKFWLNQTAERDARSPISTLTQISVTILKWSNGGVGNVAEFGFVHCISFNIYQN